MVVVALQRPLDAFRERLLDIGKLILFTVLFIIFGVLPHSFFVLEGIVVVVYPHDAVKGIGEGPVESGSESRRLRFKGCYRRTDLEISSPATLDGDGQPPLAEKHILAVTFRDIAHREVILHIVFEEVPAFFADALHDRPLSKDDRASFAALPEFRACQPLADERGAEVVEQFGAKLVAICRWDASELRQRLRKGWRQRPYASGGSSSDGTASG